MDLYALPPEEFTAARDAAAKQDKALKALRKPTVSAWVLNTLVRREAGLLEDLLALGPLLTDAQQRGNGDALRRLGEQRRQLIASVTTRALDLAGRPTSPAVRSEVESTLEAALADPASAEAVRSGQLLRPLTYAGFGGVDLEGSVAAPVRSPRPPRATTRASVTSGGPDVGAAEAVALAAAGALDDAVRQAAARAEHVAAHAGQLAAARQEEQAATELVAAAEADLLAARSAAEALRKRRTGLENEQEALIRKAAAASKGVAHAQDAADAARKALDKVRRGR